MSKAYFKKNSLYNIYLMKKDIVVVTGGAGFVGSNLIKKLLKFKGFKIISVDDYSTGKKKII